MKLRSLLIVNAFVLGTSGIFAILLPKEVLSLYGVTPDPSALLMAQYAGLGSISIGLIAWFNRNTSEQQSKRTLVPAFLITYVIGVIISVLGSISGIMKIGWPVAGIYLLFAFGYGSFQFSKRN